MSLSISVSNSAGGTLTYSASGLPAGLKINSATGQITGTLAAGTAANGPFSATVTAGDGTYTANQTFTWNINSPVTMAPVADQTNVEGNSVSLSVSASDSGGGTLAYTAAGLPRA